MIEKLLEIFGHTGIHKIGMITGVASQVVRTIDQELAGNHEHKVVAIDSIIEILQKHKNIPIEACKPAE